MSSSPKEDTGNAKKDIIQFYFVVRPLSASPLSFAGTSIIDFKTSNNLAVDYNTTTETTGPADKQATVVYSKTFGRHCSDLYWVCGNNKRISKNLFKIDVTFLTTTDTSFSVHPSLARYAVSVQAFDKNKLLFLKHSSARNDSCTPRPATTEVRTVVSNKSDADSDDVTSNCTQSTACIRASDTCAAWSTNEMECNTTYPMRLDDTLIISNFAELTLAAVVIEQNEGGAQPNATSQKTDVKGRNACPMYRRGVLDDVFRVKLTYGTWPHVAREGKHQILLEAAELRATQKRARTYAQPPLPPSIEEVQQLRATASLLLLHEDRTMPMEGEGPTVHQVAEVDTDERTHDAEVHVTPRFSESKAAATPHSSQQQQEARAPSVQTTSSSTSTKSETASAKRRRSAGSATVSQQKGTTAPRKQKAMRREDTNGQTNETANATVTPAEVPSTDHETAPVACVGTSVSILVAKSVSQRHHHGNTPTEEIVPHSRITDVVGQKSPKRNGTTKERNTLSASFISASDSLSAENSYHSGLIVRRTPKRVRPSSLNNSYFNDNINTCAETFDRHLNEALLELEQDAFVGNDSNAAPKEDGVVCEENVHNLLGADEEECVPRSVISATYPPTTTTTTTTTTSATTSCKKRQASSVTPSRRSADSGVAPTPTARDTEKDSSGTGASLPQSSQHSDLNRTSRTSRSRSSKRMPPSARVSAKKKTTPLKKSPAKAKKPTAASRTSTPPKGLSPSAVNSRLDSRRELARRKISLSAGDALVRQHFSHVKTQQTGLKSNFGLLSEFAPQQPNNADSQEVFFEH